MKKSHDFATFWQSIEAILTAVPSTNTIFNQYRDYNDQLDLPDAAAIRTDNLRRYMAGATETATILVVGEAAGPWGCRFSGVPFTSEKQLIDPSFPLRGNRSSKTIPTCPTKVAPPFISMSAVTFWDVMRPHHGSFLLWNAFPLHSHRPLDVLTVRNPTNNEVSQFGIALRIIKEYIKPKHIVAVGKKAVEILDALGEAPVYVRHPSRGGQKEFSSGMRSLFENEGTKR